jgi:S-adenosylmethionine synthetase
MQQISKAIKQQQANIANKQQISKAIKQQQADIAIKQYIKQQQANIADKPNEYNMQRFMTISARLAEICHNGGRGGWMVKILVSGSGPLKILRGYARKRKEEGDQ